MGGVDLPLDLLENYVHQQRLGAHQSSQARARNPKRPRRTRHTPARIDQRLLDGRYGNRWRHHRGNFPARKSRSTSHRFTIFARRSENVSHMRRSRTRPGRGLRRAGPSSISLRNSSIRRSRAVARCAGEPYEMRWKLPQQYEHIGRPSLSLRRRTRLLHRGHRKKLQDPPFGKRRCSSGHLTLKLDCAKADPHAGRVIGYFAFGPEPRHALRGRKRLQQQPVRGHYSEYHRSQRGGNSVPAAEQGAWPLTMVEYVQKASFH